jgi:hypothetical protein
MTGRETVVNKALSGDEVKALLRLDFERLLANEGLLSTHMAYGRIGWDFRLRLHMTNWMAPESESTLASRNPGQNLVRDNPKLAAVSTPPLEVPPDSQSIVSASEISHSVTSPNSERVTAGIPIPVIVRQQDGTTSEQKITYPAPEAGALVPENIKITDKSLEARQDWNLQAPAPAQAPAPLPAIPNPAPAKKEKAAKNA